VWAVRSALLEGIVSGGGAVLTDIAKKNHKKWIVNGEKGIAGTAMVHALMAPATQILKNAGVEKEDEMDSKLSSCENGDGWDMKSHKYGNMIKMGVIDPAKVTKTALRNAVSVASTILSTNAIVTLARTYEQEA